MAANNVAEIILRVTTEGQGNAQALAVQLTQLDQATNKVATTTLAAVTAQKEFNAEIGKTPPATALVPVAPSPPPDSHLEKTLQDWSNLQKQVDNFTTHTLRDFSSTSAHALTQWIEGSKNAKQAFAGFVTSVIEGILQILIQQIIANTILRGINQATSQENQQQSSQQAGIGMVAYLAKAGEQGGWVGVLIGLAVMLAAVAALAAVTNSVSRHAAGGPIYGAGGETSDSIPAWLSHNEFVQPAAAHHYYGTDVMEAMRTRSLPREAIRASMEHRSFAYGGPVVPTRGFAEGGIAVRMAGGGIAPNVNVGGATVLLAFGPAEIDRLMATSEMQKHLNDHLDRNAHRIARNIKRSGGHRQE
jgi:hypothetical protein